MESKTVFHYVIIPPTMGTLQLLGFMIIRPFVKSLAGTTGSRFRLHTLWVCRCIEEQSFLMWPACPQDQQYKILSTSASANPVATTGSFWNLYNPLAKTPSQRHRIDTRHNHTAQQRWKSLTTIIHDDLGQRQVNEAFVNI
jgi:hypothetical protein